MSVQDRRGVPGPSHSGPQSQFTRAPEAPPTPSSRTAWQTGAASPAWRFLQPHCTLLPPVEKALVYALSLRGILLDPAKRVPPCSALEVDPDCSPLPLVPRDPWMRPPGGGVVGHSRCPSEDRKPRLPSLGQEVKILTAGMTGERVTHPWVVRHLCWQVWESPLQLAGFPTLEAC